MLFLIIALGKAFFKMQLYLKVYFFMDLLILFL